MDDECISTQDLNPESNSSQTGSLGPPRYPNETGSLDLQQPKAAYCDSCDSDDYADSDN